MSLTTPSLCTVPLLFKEHMPRIIKVKKNWLCLMPPELLPYEPALRATCRHWRDIIPVPSEAVRRGLRHLARWNTGYWEHAYHFLASHASSFSSGDLQEAFATACNEDHCFMARTLLCLGVTADAVRDNRSAVLCDAAAKGNMRIVKLLLEEVPGLTADDVRARRACLLRSLCRHGSVENVRLLYM